jgi:hypothetical protein
MLHNLSLQYHTVIPSVNLYFVVGRLFAAKGEFVWTAEKIAISVLIFTGAMSYRIQSSSPVVCIKLNEHS